MIKRFFYFIATTLMALAVAAEDGVLFLWHRLRMSSNPCYRPPMPNIIWSREKLEHFKAHAYVARKVGADVFNFERLQFRTDEARDLIDYLEREIDK